MRQIVRENEIIFNNEIASFKDGCFMFECFKIVKCITKIRIITHNNVDILSFTLNDVTSDGDSFCSEVQKILDDNFTEIIKRLVLVSKQELDNYEFVYLRQKEMNNKIEERYKKVMILM
jgi:BMFP domain-containing protein YqiC